MRRTSLPLLGFSPQQQRYTLTHGNLSLPSDLLLSPQDWQAWLGTVSAFAFENRFGEHYTIRKERLRRGDGYWYAYRSIRGHTRKRYLGPTSQFSFALLEALHERFSEQKQQALPLSSPKADGTKQRASDARESFLETRVHPPRLPAHLVERRHLLDLLDVALTQPLTVLCATAGSGKTTLLSEWVHRSRDSWQHVAWLSLEETEDDPARFWVAVIAALQHSLTDHPSPGAKTLAMLQAQAPRPAFSLILTTFINELNNWSQEVVLILDDYHLITEPDIHASLLFLVEHLPSHLHLILSSRTEPDLPLARLRARGQMSEIHDSDLRFTHEEAHTFLTGQMHLPLSEADVASIEARTENWIAGLHLAALLFGKREDLASLVQTFTGSHRFLLDYFHEEVLAREEASIQNFLLQTAVLTSMNAALCQAVTGASSLQACQQILAKVERAHLFVVPLDDEHQWYRLHALFREALLARLQATHPELVARLHLRAARWYEAQGLLEKAIAHALEACDDSYAADLLSDLATPDSWENEYHLLRRFLARLPSDVLTARPDLSLLSVSTLILTSPRGPNTLDLVMEPLNCAERGYRARADQAGLGAVEIVRAVLLAQQGEFVRAFALARTALDQLPEQDRMWRGHGLTLLGTEALCVGDLVQAEQLIRRGLLLYEASSSLPGTLFATTMLGEVALSQGNLHGAAQLFRRVLALSSERRVLRQKQLTLEQGLTEAYYEHVARYGLAQLAYEWNHLEEAEQLLQQAQAEAPQTWLPLLTAGFMLRVHLLLTTNQFQQAQAFLHEQAARNLRPEVLREIACCQAFLALRRGNLAQVEHWARTLPASGPLVLARREEEQLLLARLHLAQGQPHAALEVLEDVKGEAWIETRKRSALQILLLEAVAQDASGARDQAKETLMQACLQARPEDYHRLFLDEGTPIEALLRTLVRDRKAGTLSAYVRTLLQTFSSRGDISLSQTPTSSWLTEPLTPQERRVLRLLAEGASNQEIAEHLIVSLATAKKHVANILAKLGAQNRTQAGALARDSGLLS